MVVAQLREKTDVLPADIIGACVRATAVTVGRAAGWERGPRGAALWSLVDGYCQLLDSDPEEVARLLRKHAEESE